MSWALVRSDDVARAGRRHMERVAELSAAGAASNRPPLTVHDPPWALRVRGVPGRDGEGTRSIGGAPLGLVPRTTVALPAPLTLQRIAWRPGCAPGGAHGRSRHGYRPSFFWQGPRSWSPLFGRSDGAGHRQATKLSSRL